MPLYACASRLFQGAPAVVLRSDDAGVMGFDVVVPAEAKTRPDRRNPAGRRRRRGRTQLKSCRVESGRPRFGVDMTEETIPLEAGIEDRAISLTKGCYVGQEIIIRVLHRGHGRVARRLVGLSLNASAPCRSRGAIDPQRGPGCRRGHERGAVACPWTTRLRWVTCIGISRRPERR